MSRVPALLMLCALLAPDFARAEVVLEPGWAVLEVEGMTCAGCEAKVVSALSGLEGIDLVGASSQDAAACAEIRVETSLASLESAIESIQYRLVSAANVETCPRALQPARYRDAWEDPEGVDAQIISRGEEVDLRAHIEANMFTIFDFGAPWCGPCHLTTARLKTYLRQHEDVAVRAISLDAQDPTTSYALPVVSQHLRWASGLPYFLVFNREGRRIYRGLDVERAIGEIDRARAR